MSPDSPGTKFRLIRNILSQEGNKIPVKELCAIAGVSRSGYYNWEKRQTFRDEQEEADRADFEKILSAFNKRGYKKGAKSIHMTLLHNNPPVLMNLKKIRRLMKKYGLMCPIRKVNPYREIARAKQEGRVAKNILNRNFRGYGARKVLLTDITYIPMKKGFLYLSVIMDAFTKQVLSYVSSESLLIDFVLRTVKQLVEKHGDTLSAETMIHSDQGCHYTSHKFIDLIKDAHLRQSMSRRGNCWDNAPQESFFGHMKEDIEFEGCEAVRDYKDKIDDWMDYYNNERYQWDLAKLSPNEYYQYIVTGNYPIKDK